MITYDVHFAKIGRGSFVPPLYKQIKAADVDALADRIETIASGYLASKDFDVEVHANGAGRIYAGGREVGMFTWKTSA